MSQNFKSVSAIRKWFLALIVGLVFTVAGHAQILHPVHWSYGAKRISKTEAVIFFKADIDDGWHLYSQYVADGGPIKTSFTFQKSPDFILLGTVAEPKPISRMEKEFGMMISFFEKSVIFQQKIKLVKGQATVAGTLQYMTCNDEKCLPPEDVAFSIPVK